MAHKPKKTDSSKKGKKGGLLQYIKPKNPKSAAELLQQGAKSQSKKKEATSSQPSSTITKPTSTKKSTKKRPNKKKKSQSPTTRTSQPSSQKKVSLRNIRYSGGLFTESALLKLRDSPKHSDLSKWKSFALTVEELEMKYDHEYIYTEAWKYIQSLWKHVAFTFDEMSSADRFRIWLIPLFQKLGYNFVYTDKEDSISYPELGHFQINYRQTDDGPPLLHTIHETDISSFNISDSEDPEGLTFHEQCQRYVNTYLDYNWIILTNGKLFRLITKYAHAYSQSYLQFDLQNIIEEGDQQEFALFYRICHKSRFKILRDYDVNNILGDFKKSIEKLFVSIPKDFQTTLFEAVDAEIDVLIENNAKSSKDLKPIESRILKQLEKQKIILDSNLTNQIKNVFKTLLTELKEILPITSETKPSVLELYQETIAKEIYEVNFNQLETFLVKLHPYLEENLKHIESGEMEDFDEASLQVQLFQWNHAYSIHEDIQKQIKKDLSKIFKDELQKKPLIDAFLESCKQEGEQIGKILSKNVTLALELLGNGLILSNPDFEDALTSETISIDEFYTEILRVIYRILFILYGEERHMFPGEGTLFHQYYSFAQYHYKLSRPILEDDDLDNWANFQTILHILETGNDMLGIKGYGDFFSVKENFTLILEYQLTITNSTFLEILKQMTVFQNEGLHQNINFIDLAEEEIGGIYETLLENKPRMDEGIFQFDHDMLDRRTSGSYYTAKTLIEIMIEQALKPVVQEKIKGLHNKEKKVDAILSTTVLDPSCGGGSILLAATDYLGKELAQAMYETQNPTNHQLRVARRKVVQHCIYGVDLNPLAVELCKMSLWLRVAMKQKPLGFLDNHIKCGNSLIGFDLNRFNKNNEFDNNVFDLRIQPEWIKAIIGKDKTGIENESSKKAKKIRDILSLELKNQPLNMWILNEKSSLKKCYLASKNIINSEEDNLIHYFDKKRIYKDFINNPLLLKERLLADLYTSSFFWPHNIDSCPCPTNNNQIIKILNSEDPEEIDDFKKIYSQIYSLKKQHSYFHWFLEFPEIFGKKNSGFDVILSNPPWDKVQLNEIEFFRSKDRNIVDAKGQNERRKRIKKLKTNNRELFDIYSSQYFSVRKQVHYFKKSDLYRYSSISNLRTFPLFFERFSGMLTKEGNISILCPTTILISENLKFLIQKLNRTNSINSFIDFENENIFPIDSRFHFVILTSKNLNNLHKKHEILASFMQTNPEIVLNQIKNIKGTKNESKTIIGTSFINLNNDDFAIFNPNTKTTALFNNIKDFHLLEEIYKTVPIFLFENDKIEVNSWGIKFAQLIDIVHHSHLFVSNDKISRKFSRRISSYTLEIDDSISLKKFVPIYEGKMINFYDHRFSSSERSQGYKFKSKYTSLSEHKNVNFEIEPVNWIKKNDFLNKVDNRPGLKKYKFNWLIGFRMISSRTNKRSFICTILPKTALGNSLFLILGQKMQILIANLSSFCFDYIVRQKIGGTNMNLFIVKQLPVFPPDFYSNELFQYISSRVIELSYTSWSLKDFAVDCGYDDKPFEWNEERRYILKAELDALFFHLYDLNEKDVDYVMETFPIIKREDIEKFGEYRTKILIQKCFKLLTNNPMLKTANWNECKKYLIKQKSNMKEGN